MKKVMSLIVVLLASFTVYIYSFTTIVCGECTVDESAITGGGELTQKRVGDTVLCGSLNRAGEVYIRAAHTGKNTVLQRKISELSHAELPHALSVAASALGMTAVFTLIFRGKGGEK